MRGADVLIKMLEAEGVTDIFSLSGNQIMPVYDACVDSKIKIMHTRHEASTIFMADAYAQLTGQIGVSLVTAAPGFGNALGALFTASGSESPVLFLSGDAPVAQDGRGAFQEFDQVAASAPFTKHSKRVMSADDMANDVAEAIAIAKSGRPGPVHLALPFDVVQAETTQPNFAATLASYASAPSIHDSDVAAITDALATAKTPVIITGPLLNKTRAGELLTRLQQAANAPVLTLESPRGLKDPSLGSVPAVFAEADLIVSLGKRIDFTVGFGNANQFGPECRWIVVDAEPAARDQAQRNLGDRLHQSIDSEPRAVAEALVSANIPAVDRQAWISKTSELTHSRDFASAKSAPAGTITPLSLCEAVARVMEKTDNAVLMCDGGEFGQWSQACLSADERVINGVAGAIGGTLPAALAARTARSQATIFALMGDGTAGFQFSEFETAAREKLPFIIIIGNDACWNAEHQIQLRDYGPERLLGCTLTNARYDLAAAGLGGHGEFVTKLDQLDAALERAVASGLPACVNVQIHGLPAPIVPGH
ncbi:MAG: thiamine pyrophosphate-binding protein [Filomicrobium sp.]